MVTADNESSHDLKYQVLCNFSYYTNDDNKVNYNCHSFIHSYMFIKVVRHTATT